MVQFNKDLQAATLPDQKEQLKARISHTDGKINKMVYQLYGLTAEEIQIVENFRQKSHDLLAAKPIKLEKEE